MAQRHRKNYSFSLARGQIVFLAVLLLLLCGLAFSLGIVVGYGTLTSSLREQLPEQDVLAESREESEDASFYETLTDNSSLARKQPPEPKMPIPAKIHYQVQVGAFRQKKEARALQKRLQEKGYLVMVSRADLKEKGAWFRVRVGNCDTKGQAGKLAKKIKKEEHLPALIVK